MSFAFFRPAHYVVVVAVIVFFAAVSVSAQMPDHEMAALFQLYNSTNGDSWQWMNEFLNGPKWNFIKNEEGDYLEDACSSGWQGLTCSREPQICLYQTCRVTHIELPSYKLTGTIPSEIGNLVTLESLIANDNALSGNIPSEIGNLSMLKNLYLNHNAFSGHIRSEIGNLVMMETLNLYNNALSGPIPGHIGNLTALTGLYLHNSSVALSLWRLATSSC
jgi:hypothetical protein